MSHTPHVSVVLQTFNHEPYIAQAIESVLVQQRDFEIEVILAEDCSADGTREIVRDYAARYPEIIRTLLPKRNLGAGELLRRALAATRGAYVAWLDGDDYWTSPEKLRRQVELLETNLDWASCFHDVEVVYEGSRSPSGAVTPAFEGTQFELDDILRWCFVPGPSCMVRRALVTELPEWIFDVAWVDWAFHIWSARSGSIGYLAEPLAAYRVHEGGQFSSMNRSDHIREDLALLERLLQALPERRELVERCVTHRHCQLAVEEANLPYEAPVILLGDECGGPLFFNGRHAVAFGPDEERAQLRTHGLGPRSAIASLARRLAANDQVEPYYRPRHPPRPAERRSFYCLVPHGMRGWLGERTSLREQFDGAALVYHDEWCDIRELPLAPAAEAGTVERTAVITAAWQTPRNPALLRSHLDRPKPDTTTDGARLVVAGWAVGARSAAVAVELEVSGRAFSRLLLGRERPGLAKAFPDRPEALHAGFNGTISLLGTEPEIEVGVRAVLADGTRAPVGGFRARHLWRDEARYAELVSVVIPCFQQAHFLAETIESVLAQTYPNLEVLVIDDGSRDNTGEIVRRYPGVRYLRQRNAGLSAARNVGIRETEGDFLVFLDADDRLLPHAIEVGVAALREHPGCAFATGAARHIRQDGTVIHVLRYPPAGEDAFASLLATNWAGEPARSLYRRDAVEEAGGFDETLWAAEDYDLNLRITESRNVAPHDDAVADRREHPAAMSTNSAMMLAQTLRVARRHRRAARRRGRGDAYAAAVSLWRSYFGDPLIDDIKQAARDGHRRRAASDAVRLARHHPRGLVRLVRH